MGEKKERYFIPKSKRVAIIANMTALALLGNYVLVPIPNVELGTVIIFITSLVFGLEIGIWTALLTSLIFASFNPWGPFIPQIWTTQVIAWMYVAAVGGMMRPKDLTTFQSRRKMFITGGFLAFIFDLVTNIGYSLAFGIQYYIAVLFGLPFMIIHVVSTSIIMAVVVPAVEPILKRDLAPMIWEGITQYSKGNSILEVERKSI